MPTVPTYNDPQVGLRTLPDGQLGLPSYLAPQGAGIRVQSQPDTAGSTGQQLGQGMTSLGDAVGQIADKMAQQVNNTAVNAQMNDLMRQAQTLTYDKDQGYLAIKGQDAALPGANGDSLTSTFSSRLQDSISRLSGGLTNPVQQQMFAARANDLLTRFQAGVQEHTLSEYKSWSLSTQQGTAVLAANQAELGWNDPGRIGPALESAQTAVRDAGVLQGLGESQIQANINAVTSGIHAKVIGAALTNNNPTYAMQYFQEHKGEMDADDSLKVQGLVTKVMNTRIGMQKAADAVTRIDSAANPTDLGRAFNILIGAESGGRQFATDGSPLTSPKGATGVAQMMPATAKEWAIKSGIGWDEQRYKTDAAYNRAVGLWGFQSLVQQNGGDLSKAYAAYNAGPGAVRRAEQQWETGKSAGQPNTAGGWLAYLPAETQKYVTKNMAAYGAGEGVPSRASLADIDNALTSDPALASNPEALAIARQEAERRYKLVSEQRKDQADQAVGNAYKEVLANGGSFANLSLATRTAIPGKDLSSVMDFAKKVAKGDDTTDLRAYQKLSDPDYLKGLSDGDFYRMRAVLSDADFKHFANERTKAQGGQSGANGPGDLNSSAIKFGLDQRLQMVGVNTSPKSGSGDAQRIGGIRQFVDQYMLTAQQEAGKKFTDAEVSQRLDHLFATNATVKGWSSDSSKPMLAMNAGDIDSGTLDRIKSAYAKRGVSNPTDTQILSLYWANQTYGRSK